MKVKALVSFAGKVSAGAGQIIEITDKEVLADLSHAGYIEPIETKKPAKKKKVADKNDD